MSGSVRYPTLVELVQRSGNQPLVDMLRKPKDLAECFQVFGILHRLITNTDILREITRRVLDDFHADNCVYLELRTTPRAIKDETSGRVLVSKHEYLEAISTAIDEFEKDTNCKYHKTYNFKVNENNFLIFFSGAMLVRLILSIDRGKPVEDGLETIEFCHEMRNSARGERIVGVDFSGDPKAGSLHDKFRPCLDLVRRYSLPVTIHIGEIWNDDADLKLVLEDYRPDRIGHAVCLSDADVNKLIARPIPIEICPSSNLATRAVDHISTHRFGDFYKARRDYPMCVCTDDSGLFDTSLTRENHLIAQTFELGVRDMFELNKRSARIVFDKSPRVQQHLADKFDAFEKKFLNS